MSEVRCPMCSKPNPEDAEACEFCGARIKPLFIGAQPEDEGVTERPSVPTPQEPAGEPSQESDWLDRMRGGMEDDGTDRTGELSEDQPEPDRGSTDLLGRFRGLGLTEGEDTPQEEISDAPLEEPQEPEFLEPAPERGSTDLLGRMSDLGLSEWDDAPSTESFDEAQEELEEAAREGIAEPEIPADSPEPLADFESDEVEAEVPDWLIRIRERRSEDDASPVEPKEDVDWLSGLREVPQAAEPDVSEPEPELEKKPPFIDIDAGLEGEVVADEPFSEALFEDPDFLADLQPEESDEPSSLDDLFEDLEGQVDLVEKISAEEQFPGLDDEPVTRSDLDEILGDSAGEWIDDVVPDADQEISIKPMEIKNGTSPLQDLFEELDKELQTGELPALQADSLPEPKSEEEVDAALIELLEEFDHETKRDAGLFKDEAEKEIEGEIARDISLDEIFSDIPISKEDQVSDIEDVLDDLAPDDEPVEEVKPPTQEELSAIKEVFGDITAAPVEEVEPVLDPSILADLGVGSVDRDELPSAVPPFDVPLGDEALAEPDLDIEFEPADIEPESLAPGSDQLAVGPRSEDFEESVAEPLPAIPLDLEAEATPSPEREISEFTPDWLSEGISEDEFSAEPTGDLPHVPALITDEDEDKFEGLGDHLLSSEVAMDDMPTWLQDLGEDIDEDELEQEEEPEWELAKAKLPPWLEAMRSIETFRAESEFVEEEEQEITEAAGPLAGLKGVLLAEPVVAMPRSASTGAAALDITERHYINTEILRQMVGEEELELARPEVRVTPLPIVRWIIGLLLILAVAVPILIGFPSFKEPTLGPRELVPFRELMNSLPLGQPVLLVFDYEPGFSPEMDAVAGAMVENLIGRGQPIVSLSSRPTGPLLADRMILRIGGDRELENGVDFLHLGYLSGGSTGIQLFASSPRSSIVDGFRPPEGSEGANTWETPILTEIHNLNDFSMIAIITSGSEAARNWIEQLNLYIEQTPLVVVSSAGAEPMIRPYYESDTPQVQGILSGLRSAITYEVRNGRLSDATQNWNAFGAAMLMAELILISGIAYGVGNWFIQRRLSSEE